MSSTDLAGLLARYAVFRHLDAGALAALERELVWFSLPGGRPLFKAGEPADALYLLKTGSLGVLPIKPDGSLSDAVHVMPLPGEPGPHRVEQTSSHPHQVVFDPTGRYLVSPDKGSSLSGRRERRFGPFLAH